MDLNIYQFDPSCALEAILDYGPKKILCCTPQRPAPYLHLEALAQSCGLHLRYIHNFQVQAFLVSIANLTYPLDQAQECWTITATLCAHTSTAALYTVSFLHDCTCTITMGYQDRETVDTYFQDRFLWLSTRFFTS